MNIPLPIGSSPYESPSDRIRDFTQSPIQIEIDSAIKQFMQQHGFSGSVMVVQNGQPTFAQAYGEATAGQANEQNTTFRWDSVSKLITTTGILQLYEKNKLNLDDPITKYLPEYKNSPGLGGKPPVTIRSLLTMTSGIADLPPLPGPAEWQNRAPTLKEIMDYVAEQPRKGQGTWSYSNTSFNLLGVIIGKISQPNTTDPASSYSEYIQKNIFDPAGMTSASAPSTLEQDSPSARCHSYDESGNLVEMGSNQYPDYITMRFGAGNLNGSMWDFEKFDAALNTGKLITMKDLDLMQSQRFGGWDPGNHSINGHSFMSKGGAQDGEQSFYMRFPNNTMVYIMANVGPKNQNNPQDHIQFLGAEIAQLLMREEL